MTTATVGALKVVLGIDSAAFTEGLSAAQKQLRGVGRQMESFGKSLTNVGVGLTAAVTAPLIGLGAMAVNEASEMRDAVGQVEAALTSMGGAGDRSLEQLKTQADALAGASLFEDDQILRGVTANLLTFGNVSGQAFDRAQQAAVDLATRMQMDLQPATLLIGKALNDPIKGLTALSRAGIQFTTDQQAAIRSMVAMGDAAGAQSIILGELERQFGGSALAARNAANPMERMRLAFSALAGDIGTVLLPIVDKIAAAFEGMTQGFGKLSPGMQQFVVIAGGIAAALGPALVAMGALVASVGAIVSALGAGGLLAGLIPFLGPIALAVAAVSAAFMLWGDEIIPVLVQFGKTLADTIGPKIAPLWEAIKGAVQAVGAVFSAIFGPDAPEGVTATLTFFGEVIARVFGAAVDLVTGAINVITNVLNAIAALLRGDFSAMWGYLGQAVMSVVRAIASAFETLFPEVVAWVRRTYEGVKEWLLDKFADVVRGIGEKVAQVTGFFKDMWDAVVGNSWVPDMVIAIADWMGPRLQAAMVDPALAAVDQTASAFEGMTQSVSSQMDSLFRSITSKDWTGALGSIFDILSGQGGSLGSFGKIGSAILGAFTGSSSGVRMSAPSMSGASKVASPQSSYGEMVNTRSPGAMTGGLAVTVNPSPYFDVQVEKVASRPAARAGMQAVGASRSIIPGELARSARYRLGRS